MQYDRHGIAALVGSHVTVRRYVQPTMRSGDPDRQLSHDCEGTVEAIDRQGRMVVDGCDEPVFPEPSFLGGDSARGTCKYLVTEVYRDGEDEAEVMAASGRLPDPVGTPEDSRGRPRTVFRDGGEVVVPAGRYNLSGLSQLISVLTDARGQLMVPEAGTMPPGLECSACRKPLSGHERGSDGVTYLCPAIGSATRAERAAALQAELAAAASAAQAARDAREAWNDPEDSEARDVQ